MLSASLSISITLWQAGAALRCETAQHEACCCRLIVQAVRAGGPGSDNSRLRDLLAQARTVNIPKDIIERNIRNGSAPNQADYVEVKDAHS